MVAEGPAALDGAEGAADGAMEREALADAVAWERLEPPASTCLVRCLPLAALRECRSASQAWRRLGRGACAVEELWQRDVDKAQRSLAWKALLLDGLSLHTRRAADASYEDLSQTPSSYDAVITRDIGRTLPREDLFREKSGKGQGALFRLLRALAQHFVDIGYVQSLNFVVATLITVFPDDEALVFHCARALLFRHSLADFYRPGFPKLGVAVWQFDRMVEGFLPKVHSTLQEHGVTAEYYAMQWFLALFAGDLPQPIVRRVWDRFLIAGWQVIVQVGLALLEQVQDELLAFDMCEVLTFLKKFVRLRTYDGEELLRSASTFEVSHRMLSELEAAYTWEGVDARLHVESSPSGRIQWAVLRRQSQVAACSLTAGAAAVAASPSSSSASSQARSRQPGPGGPAAQTGTVLPFLVRNLDTGETTLLEQEWGKYMREVSEIQRGRKTPVALRPPSPPPAHCRQEQPPPSAVAPAGSYWLQGRQQEALRVLGKA